MNISSRTWIEIDKQAFDYNINNLKSCIGDTQIAIVLKSNAYGHDITTMAYLSDKSQYINYICTAGLSEAILLRKNNIKKPIIVLSYLDGDLKLAVINDIHCVIYDYETACILSNIAKKLNKIVNIHVKVDTGMSRLGILPEEVISFIKALQTLSNIYIYGIFTHLCDTSNSDKSFSLMQLERFDKVLDSLKKINITIECTHALSSSGLSVIPKRNYTLIRAGGALYGLCKSFEHLTLIKNNYPQFNIKPIITWKSNIIQIKDIPKNSYIGYNKSYQAKKSMRIAIIPVGYFDGLPRTLSNKGTVIIKNQEAPIVGIISMNLLSIDITHIPDATISDQVILMGSYNNINALNSAIKANTITNEIVARINSDIPRIITN
jgi:alanine racemase